MCAKRIMHRVVAEAGGSLHTLLSLRENAKGSLIVKPRDTKFNIVDGVRRVTDDQKITVHAKGQGSPNSIHHTLASVDGSKVETHIMTRAVALGRVDFLYLYTVPTFPEPATQVPREADPVVRLGDYLPSHSTLHIVVLIAPPSAQPAIINPSAYFSHRIIQFKRFSVVVAWAYSYLPSIIRGWLKHWATADISYDGERNRCFLPIRDGLRPAEAKIAIEHCLGVAHIEAIRRASAYFADSWDLATSQSFSRVLGLGIRPVPYIPGMKLD